MNYPINKIKEPQTSTAKFAAVGAFLTLKSRRNVSDENDFLTDTAIIIK